MPKPALNTSERGKNLLYVLLWRSFILVCIQICFCANVYFLHGVFSSFCVSAVLKKKKSGMLLQHRQHFDPSVNGSRHSSGEASVQRDCRTKVSPEQAILSLSPWGTEEMASPGHNESCSCNEMT